jgi:hypothetical protein
MKNTVKMGSVVMTYIPSSIKIDLGIQMLTEGDSQTQTAWGSQTPTLKIAYVRLE